jgi:hypothetical protein
MLVRKRLQCDTGGYASNAVIGEVGLRSLVKIYRKQQAKSQTTKNMRKLKVINPVAEEARNARKQIQLINAEILILLSEQAQALVKINDKQTQLLAICKKMLRELEKLNEL